MTGGKLFLHSAFWFGAHISFKSDHFLMLSTTYRYPKAEVSQSFWLGFTNQKHDCWSHSDKAVLGGNDTNCFLFGPFRFPF